MRFRQALLATVWTVLFEAITAQLKAKAVRGPACNRFHRLDQPIGGHSGEIPSAFAISLGHDQNPEPDDKLTACPRRSPEHRSSAEPD